MNTLNKVLQWAASEDGQDLIEYAMLVALISLVALGAVTTVGNTINTVFWETISAATGNL